MFTYHVLRDEWVGQVGHIDQYGDPKTFRSYWTSKPFNNREDAAAALEEHYDVLEYSEQLMRYKMRKAYTHAHVVFRQTEVDQFER